MTYYMLLFTFHRNIAFVTAFEHMRPLTELKKLKNKIQYHDLYLIVDDTEYDAAKRSMTAP